MIRRLAVIGLLLGGAILLEPLRVPTPGVIAPRSLFLFGVLLLVAETLGTFLHDVGLPRIVGYLVAGLLLGPSLLGIVPDAVLTDIAMVKQLAIGIIGLLAGVELKIPEVRSRGRVILAVIAGQVVAVLALVGAGTLLARPLIPFLSGLPLGAAALVALTFATVLAVNSPMVALAMLEETGARGPVARTVLGVVLVADVVVILLFTVVFALTRAATGGDAITAWAVLGSLSRDLGGAVVAGVLIGALVAAYLRFVTLELPVFVIVVAFAAAAASEALHFELLLALLVAGFVVENVAPVRAEPLVATLRQVS